MHWVTGLGVQGGFILLLYHEYSVKALNKMHKVHISTIILKQTRLINFIKVFGFFKLGHCLRTAVLLPEPSELSPFPDD